MEVSSGIIGSSAESVHAVNPVKLHGPRTVSVAVMVQCGEELCLAFEPR